MPQNSFRISIIPLNLLILNGFDLKIFINIIHRRNKIKKLKKYFYPLYMDKNHSCDKYSWDFKKIKKKEPFTNLCSQVL